MSPIEETTTGEAVIAEYFEHRITRAERGVEEARAALAQAEAQVERRRAERRRAERRRAELAAFAADGSLHPLSYTEEPVEDELCQWARTRIVCAVLDGEPVDGFSEEKLRAQEEALHQWLRERGRPVPNRFRTPLGSGA
ncbi:hypothetical protein ACF1D2_29645 [Streptomyces bacillaris]|uniref:hypothetical protein n=1 Tax=Streptomyces bacillaris TaxID=68179 RepID=UPI003702077C